MYKPIVSSKMYRNVLLTAVRITKLTLCNSRDIQHTDKDAITLCSSNVKVMVQFGFPFHFPFQFIAISISVLCTYSGQFCVLRVH